MKKILTSTLLAAASLCMAFTEKFDTAERFLPADFPVMAKEGGVDNSPCAVFRLPRRGWLAESQNRRP